MCRISKSELQQFCCHKLGRRRGRKLLSFGGKPSSGERTGGGTSEREEGENPSRALYFFVSTPLLGYLLLLRALAGLTAACDALPSCFTAEPSLGPPSPSLSQCPHHSPAPIRTAGNMC